MQATEVDSGSIDVHHIDVKLIDRSWPHFGSGIERVPRPLVVLAQQMKTPDELFFVQIESEQAIESG